MTTYVNTKKPNDSFFQDDILMKHVTHFLKNGTGGVKLLIGNGLSVPFSVPRGTGPRMLFRRKMGCRNT